MLHLNVCLMFYFREHLKMYKNVKEKMHFILHLMIHSTVQSKGAAEGTLQVASNDALTNLYKDAQEVALEVAPGLHLWLLLLMQSLIYKFEKQWFI